METENSDNINVVTGNNQAYPHEIVSCKKIVCSCVCDSGMEKSKYGQNMAKGSYLPDA